MNSLEKGIGEKAEKVRTKAKKVLEGQSTSPRKKESLKKENYILALLNEMEYTLQKDIPKREIMEKISTIEEEINSMEGAER